MFTIKSLKSGKNAVYVKNDVRGRKIISELLYANEGRYGKHTGLKVKPLTSGKIAIYIENSMLGRELVSTVLTSTTTNPPRVPYALDSVEDDFDDMEFDDEEFDEDDFEEMEFADEGEAEEVTEKFEMKCCTKCGQWKGLEGFYRQRDGLHGRRGDCIECYKQARSPKAGMKTEPSQSNVITIFAEEDGNVYAVDNGGKFLECNIGTFDENFQRVKQFCKKTFPEREVKLDASAFDALCEGLPY